MRIAIRLVLLITLSVATGGCDATPAQSCQPGLTVDGASRIARTLAIAGQPSDMAVAEISSSLYASQPVDQGAWRIQVDAVGVFRQANQPGGTVSVPMHWLIEVDTCTGHASVIGQG